MSAETEPKTFRNVVLTGCLGCLGLVAIVAIGIAALFFWSKNTIGTPAMSFIDTLESRDYAAAFALTGGDWRRGSTLDEFEKTYAGILDDLGPRISIRSAGFTFDGNVVSPTKARATYSAQYENAGRVFIRVDMTHVDGQWRISDATYSTRILGQAESCPHCGARIEEEDNFCPRCGAALHPAPVDDSEDPEPHK